MDRLTSMTVFARVAASRSFSAAARDLGISQATASKHVQTLEDWIGTRLLHRTTRRVGLTEAGESFYAQCTRILEDMETARQVGTPDARIRGTLRFTAPVAFGSALLGPLLVRFTQLYPDLALNVTLVDRPVDLVEEGYDLALQVIHGPLEDARQPGMLLQQLMPMPFEVCAA
ncbi:MAG: LysR family transcriptional regulator, partial [Rhodospirillales bacterium]|nr:LysR family transcriptional regulator [Rhodospirillales bacterium]